MHLTLHNPILTNSERKRKKRMTKTMRMNVYGENFRNPKLLDVWGGMRMTRELQRCLKLRVREQEQEQKQIGEGRKSEEKALWDIQDDKIAEFQRKESKE